MEGMTKTRPLSTILAVAILMTGLAGQASAGVIFPGPGWEAILSTDFHQVSGRVTVIDEDTVMVEDFVYDGQGIDVYFYLGSEDSRPSFASGLQIGPQLLGTVYDGSGGPLVIDLPDGQSLQGYGAISVWCTAADVSFGSGTFEPIPEPRASLLVVSAALLLGCRRRPGCRRVSRRA
ncbi:hypothetical protein BH23VER1_BH23VER1_06780 [soil metagenome]